MILALKIISVFILVTQKYYFLHSEIWAAILKKYNPNVSGGKSLENPFAEACPQRSWVILNLLLASFNTVESSDGSGDIVHTSMDHLHLRWFPCISERDWVNLSKRGGMNGVF